MKTRSGAVLSSIQIDRAASRKISVQLYMGLRDLILTGGIPAGGQLPASRTLAREIGVSRTTAIDAVERLVSEGLLVSRQGAGTFVSHVLDQQRIAPPVSLQSPALPDPAAPRISHTLTHAREQYAQRSWLPHASRAFVTALPALDAFPVAHWSRIATRHLRGERDAVLGYGHPHGLHDLRRAIATHLNAVRGIRCSPDQIFVTNGAQQAFSLIARVLLNPGDRVWYENPGAAGARNAFVASGADLVPVDVDTDGLVVRDGLEKAPHFRLVFTTPSHQQPLGHVMSLTRRLELLDAASDAQAMIVEDDYDGEFHFGDKPQPPLKSIDTRDRVIYVGTFSKTLFPALRLGFLLSPASLVDTFSNLFNSWVSTAPTVTQATVAGFMDEGLFATHIRSMRRLYRERHARILMAGQTLPDTLRIQPTTSGFHTIAQLDPQIDEAVVVAQADAAGITVAPLSRYCLAPVPQRGLVLGFGCTVPQTIQNGIVALRGLRALHP